MLVRPSALLAALACGACATVAPPPPRDVVDAARRVGTYSAELRVGIRGPDLRGRAAVLVAFERPDRLRLEMPGPSGARFVLVERGDRLVAVFPGARAVFEGPASADTLAELTGVRLNPPAVMDMLVGVASSEATDFRAEWGERLPKRVRLTLSDRTRLDVKIVRPETGASFPDAAFRPAPHPGFRRVSAAEARELWQGR